MGRFLGKRKGLKGSKKHKGYGKGRQNPLKRHNDRDAKGPATPTSKDAQLYTVTAKGKREGGTKGRE